MTTTPFKQLVMSCLRFSRVKKKVSRVKKKVCWDLDGITFEPFLRVRPVESKAFSRSVCHCGR
jgi:hypothetical protein